MIGGQFARGDDDRERQDILTSQPLVPMGSSITLDLELLGQRPRLDRGDGGRRWHFFNRGRGDVVVERIGLIETRGNYIRFS